jgi:hypothetical protein
MPLSFRQTAPAELEETAAFLAEHFQLNPDAPLIEPALMRWKYYEPRPDWQGSRSYVLESGPRWLAHVCVCPMPLTGLGKPARGILLVDWISAAPGAGAEIYRRFYSMSDVVFGQGGSTSAQRTLQRMGYAEIGAVRLFVRPLRPWVRFRRGPLTAMNLMRLARSAVMARLPLRAISSELTVERVPEFRASQRRMIEESRGVSFVQTERSVELLNYLLRCPALQTSAYVVRRRDKDLGYFLLSLAGAEIQLNDLRIASDQERDWTEVVALMTRAASQFSSAEQLVVRSSLPLLDVALEANRFRLFDSDPLFLYDPKGLMATRPVHITPFDGDQAYL